MANKNNDGSLGPANNYDIQEQYIDALGNAFSMLKNELSSKHGMRPVEDLDGLTLRFLGKSMVQVNHAKYIVGDVYTISKNSKPDADQFLDFMISELKKRYQKITGTPLNLSKTSEGQNLQMVSRLSPDRSWVSGQGTYQPNMCRYLMTTSRVYSVDTKNMTQ